MSDEQKERENKGNNTGERENKGNNTGEVEAHGKLSGLTSAADRAQNDDEGDDVEAHMKGNTSS